MSAAPNDSLPYRGKRIVRTLGAVLLAAACVMLVLGLTVLRERLHGPQFVLYWSWCFLITIAAILVALADLIMIRRASRQSRRKLFREHFTPHR